MGASIAQLIAPLRAGSRVHGAFVVERIDEESASLTLVRESDRGELTIELRPRDDSRPCYEATASLNVSYVGRPGAALPADFTQALRALLDVLRANDRGEPLAIRVAPTLPIVQPNEREVSTVLDGIGFVRIQSTCEMACVFCTRGTGGSLPKPRPHSKSAEIEREIERLVADGAAVIVFGGDEPLTHPELETFIRRARSAGAEAVHLVTSGHRLRDAAFVEWLEQAGVARIELPIYGPTAEIHDAITMQPGSFASLMDAVKTLRRVGLRFEFHSVLLRQNLDHLIALARFLREELNGSGVAFAHVMPRNDSVDDYRAKMPTYAEILRTLRGTDLRLESFPLCISRSVAETDALVSTPISPAPERVKPESVCATCSLAASCPGTFELYVRAYGISELAPVNR